MVADRTISIDEQDACSPHLPIVARWLSDEWGLSLGYDFSETLSWCRDLASASDEAIIVATRDRQPIGVILVVECDLEGYEHLRPWISGLYVLTEERGKGIGEHMIRAACDRVVRMRCTTLYLYANMGRLIPYYEGLGWQPVSKLDRNGESFQIMQKQLSEQRQGARSSTDWGSSA